MKKILLIATLLIFASALYAEETPELITDRPDQTESSSVVPKNHLQIEDGLLFEIYRQDPEDYETLNLSSILFRYGATDQLELRLGGGIIKSFWDENEEDNEFYITNIDIGAKFKFAEEDGYVPELAALFMVEVPISNHYEMTDNYSPSIIIAAAYTLTDAVSLGFNFGPSWDGEFDSPSIFYSLAFGFSLHEKAGAFIETYGEWMDGYDPMLLVDGGFTYLYMDNLQFDLSGGLGVNSMTEGYYFISAGLSVRLPK